MHEDAHCDTDVCVCLYSYKHCNYKGWVTKWQMIVTYCLQSEGGKKGCKLNSMKTKAEKTMVFAHMRTQAVFAF